MHIIFITDLHGKFDLLNKLPDADLLLLGGDFTQLGNRDDFKAAMAAVARRFPGYLAVPGNMDSPEAASLLAAENKLLTLENNKICRDVTIRGLGGGNKSPFNSPCEWEEEQIAPAITALEENAADIFVTHAPPFDSGADVISNGTNVGSEGLRNLLLRVKPKLWLCGHIHEARGIFSCGSVPVVNPGAFADGGNFAHIEYNDGTPSIWLSGLAEPAR